MQAWACTEFYSTACSCMTLRVNVHNLLQIICTLWCNLANVKYHGSACTFNEFAFHPTFIMHIDIQIFSHIYVQTRKQTENKQNNCHFKTERQWWNCTEFCATWGFVKLQKASVVTASYLHHKFREWSSTTTAHSSSN